MVKAIDGNFEWIDLDLDELSTSKTKRAYSRVKKNDEVKALRAKTRVLRKCLLMMAVILGMIVGVVISSYSSRIDYYEEELDDSLSTQRELKIEVEDLTDKYNTDIKAANDYATKLEEENAVLTTNYSTLLTSYRKLYHRTELYEKYSYAMQGTDITINQIEELEAWCKDSKIGDVDFILSIALVESTGLSNSSNAKSSAKGYGQFLNSTSKFVYTDLLGYSNWSADVAYDPDINLQMIVAYMDYLYDSTGSVKDAINAYAGGYSPGYYTKLNRWLAKSGKSIDTIQCNS